MTMSSAEQLLRDQRLKMLMKEDAENIKWLYQNYEKLLKKYRNLYVAIRRQEIVDADRDVRLLIARLEQRFKETEDILVYYISAKKIKLLF